MGKIGGHTATVLQSLRPVDEMQTRAAEFGNGSTDQLVDFPRPSIEVVADAICARENARAENRLVRLCIAPARRLLLETGFSVEEISALTGYTSQFFFSRQFKSITGQSPSEFREHHKA